MILRKNVQIVATKGQILRQKCSSPDPIGGAYSAPRLPSWILGALLLNKGWRGGNEARGGEGGGGRKKGRGGGRTEGEGREGVSREGERKEERE